MILSNEAFEKLDIRFVLDKIQVHTPYGRELKSGMKPFQPDQEDALRSSFELTAEAIDMIERHRYTLVEIRNQFKHVKDLTGSFERIRAVEPLTVPELFEVKALVKAMGAIAQALHRADWCLPDDLTVRRLTEVEDLLDPDGLGVNTFYLYDSYSPDLAAVRGELKTVDKQLRKLRKTIRLQAEDRLGVRIRPNGEITVSKENQGLLDKLAADDQMIYSSETYMNRTFRLQDTGEMDVLQVRKEELQAEEEAVSTQVRQWLTERLLDYLPDLEVNVRAVGGLDLLLGKAYYAVGTGAVRPVPVNGKRLRIVEGRHLKVAQRLREEGTAYTPVSVSITQGVTCITGANMGGKTVSLKMIGMLVTLAQLGLYVPAKAMEWTPVSFVFVSIGDAQDVDMGLSTFGAEIVKVKDAVRMADRGGLVLIDELARGTNPKEGYAISKALMNHMKDKPSMTVITTHFDGLADDPAVKHLQVSGLSGIDFETLILHLEDGAGGMALLHERMDYTLREIHSPQEVPKDAINISKLMGLSESILEDARNILESMGSAV